jgi:hypothetical protein
MRNFYKQLITGDGSDNIPAFDGKFRSSVPKFVQILLEPLNEMTDEWEMYDYCKNIFFGQTGNDDNDTDLMHRNGRCLYIWKKENDYWQPPLKNGPQADVTPL